MLPEHPVLDVLCVEDDPDIARVLQLMIEAVPGYRALLAEDAEAALRLLDGWAPGLAFVDLGLPDMDGVDLIYELRRRRPDLAVVVVTAYHDRRAEAFAAGATEFLSKPFDPDEVLQIVSRLGRGAAA